MKIRRKWAMPNGDTFCIKPIGEFVQRYLTDSQVSIDPFARNCEWATYTNDLNSNTKAQFHTDALDFVQSLPKRVKPDLVIFDPPYSLRQAKECYDGVGREFTQRDGQIINRYRELKDAIHAILSPNAVVLSFGWHTNGMGKKRGYEIEEILLVAHGSGHNDTICIAERRL